MMTKDEAQRIANAVNALRPDWSIAGVMSILADGRCRNKPLTDLTMAFVALALDPASRKPTRIYEHGPWWEVLAPRIGMTTEYRVVTDSDCAICSRPYELHSRLSQNDPHEWEPQHARGEGERPAPDVRAAIDAAIADAKHAAAAAKEEPAKKEPRDMNEVIASHTDRTDAA